ncbi:hypothetical protein ACE01N_14290 [Saccharicrinis sp. FJH2]|uniref:hypothetical protein n=1 Tax=Saccharicrinis sp. FJH65 TaxID=3344659 RepID=UPI0035F22E15
MNKFRVYTFSVVLLIIALFVSFPTSAQSKSEAAQTSAPIPLEVVLGTKSWTSQLIIDKKFSPESKLGFFSLSYIKANYDNDEYLRESLNLMLLKYELVKNVSVLSGAAYSSVWGFRPYAGGQYAYMSRTFMCAIISGLYLSESHNYEALAMAEYRPVIKDNWSLYTRAQALYNQNTETGKHDRSHAYGRLGLSYKTFSFGCALNYDWYGPMKMEDHQWGIFISTLLW